MNSVCYELPYLNSHRIFQLLQYTFQYKQSPVAQRVKHWFADLVVPSLEPHLRRNLLTVNEVPLHTAFRLHPFIVLI